MTRALLALVVLLASVLAVGHPSNLAAATAKVAADGTFTLRIRFDLLAFILNETPLLTDDDRMNSLLDSPDADVAARLKETEARLRTETESGGTLRTVAFPTLADIVRTRGLDPLRRLSVTGTAIFEGKLPPGVRTASFRFPPALDTVILTTEFPYQEPVSEPVPPGVRSRPLPIPTAAQIAAAARAMGIVPQPPLKTTAPPRSNGSKPPSAPPRVKSETPRTVPAEKPSTLLPAAPQATAPQVPAPATSPAPSVEAPSAEVASAEPPVEFPSPDMRWTEAPLETPSRNPLADIPRYIRIGFIHILPQGLDHILFVVGLVLVAVRTKDLLAQVSAFTVAHSLTLGLALFGVVRLPEHIVEPIIALSIAFVAIENLWTKRVGPWRLAAVFLFGLIHGLGFAGALQELGLARRDLLPALVGFNVGVELGQLAVVALTLGVIGLVGALREYVRAHRSLVPARFDRGVIGRFRGHADYRKWIVVPASLLIAALALFWTVERVRQALS